MAIRSSAGTAASKPTPICMARQSAPFSGLLLSWHLARLSSVLIGLASILLCGATVRRIWPDRPGWHSVRRQWSLSHRSGSFSIRWCRTIRLLITLRSLLVYQVVARSIMCLEHRQRDVGGWSGRHARASCS